MDSERNEVEFLGVRETARRLGVHENTVRNWARDGILPTAKLPGSRFHRFDERDVERLHQQRGKPIPSVAHERRTIGPELVDATQLSQWAATLDARGSFPELMRRLLAATPGISAVSVRAGEGTSLEGWDGRAESAGSAFLPSGPLCFELGVGNRPKQKADEDYAKRCSDPRGVVPTESTFIFATPRRWSGADAWATDRRVEGTFKDVRIIDADDLEGWLQLTPSAHYWISEHLGRRPADAETLERWWTRFSEQTDPLLPASLFLAGRGNERGELAAFLRGRPGVIAVQSRWRSDVLAFIWATIDAMGQESSHPVQAPLVVESAEVWDRVVTQPGRMTLLPMFEDPDVKTAQDQKHFVVLPTGIEQVVQGTKIDLSRPHRSEAAEALKEAGFDSDRAYDLAALARRSMPSFVRKLARDPRYARPSWSQPPQDAIIAPLVLAGAWTSSEADRGTVSRLAGNEWPEIERHLLPWLTTDDPPFVRSGTQWHLASSEEAFLVLVHALAKDHLDRWQAISVEVLLEPDPALELAPDDRPMAGITGATRECSAVLRRGLAEGIALMGSIGTDRLNDGISGPDHARLVVRTILRRANEDSSGRVWHSLADELPLLAEAAPEEFLEAIHEDLDRDVPVLATMFQDGDQGWSALFGSSPHSGLLWALEALCWSPDHLIEAVHALARLHEVDPGGRLANRPLQSLENVLVGWIRHTGATLDLKVKALEHTCRELPSTGWPLILALLPAGHASAMPPFAPRYRDWKPDTASVSIAEWIEYIGHLVRLTIELASQDVQRWVEIVEQIAPLPPPARDRLFEALDQAADPDGLDPHIRLSLWERLHAEILRHQRFSSATWAMDAEMLSRLQVIADRLEPTESLERFAYLFDWHPDLPGIDSADFEAYEARLHALRLEAATCVLQVGSLADLISLAERSGVPRHLGWVLGELPTDSLTSNLLEWLDDDSPHLREVAASWAARKLGQEEGVAWLREMLVRPELRSVPRRVTLALNAPAAAVVWNALEEIDSELSDAYWGSMRSPHVTSQDAHRAATELVAHGRAWVAIDVLAMALHRKADESTSLTRVLVETILDAALSTEPNDVPPQSLGYEIGVLLDYLTAQDSPAEKLARYEFHFFRLLDHHRKPRALFAALGDDPSLFVTLVSRVYRGKNEARRELQDGEQALASQAWWVLSDWDIPPGQSSDGTIDRAHLNKWVDDARLAFLDADRADIGDEQIGQVLGRSAIGGADGIWPAEPIRELIERIGSSSLESGLHMGACNSRGGTTRGIFDGGEQERKIAARYRDWAAQSAGRWRRTSRLLRRLAENYERDAQREDERAEISADTE